MITGSSSASKTYVLRLRPGEDVLATLREFVRLERITAGLLVSAVGSVTRAALRFANQKEATVREGHFEVVSLVGTIGSTSGEHLHMSVSDERGVTTGGHLMPGSIVYTTLEVGILSLEDRSFVRVPDPQSGYDELQIEERV